MHDVTSVNFVGLGKINIRTFVCAGMLCVGRYCAGETMLSRLISVSNAHLQTGKYYKHLSNCGTGGHSKDRVNFPRTFTETPAVFVSIYEYDLCHFGGYNRAVTRVESIDGNGFTATAQTWGDTRLYALGVEVSRPPL